MYKALGINCSPRKEGNTNIMLSKVIETLEKNGVEGEVVHVGGQKFSSCRVCGWCTNNQEKRCVIDDDFVNEIILKMDEADIIIIGSPVYFSMITAEAKALIDRAGIVCRRNGFLLKRKLGAAVVAQRRAGGIPSVDAINRFFYLNEMITTGASYWNMGFGHEEGAVVKDTEGMNNMVSLGENLAWLVKKVKA